MSTTAFSRIPATIPHNKLTVHAPWPKKRPDECITMLAACDYMPARTVDQAGIALSWPTSSQHEPVLATVERRL